MSDEFRRWLDEVCPRPTKFKRTAGRRRLTPEEIDDARARRIRARRASINEFLRRTGGTTLVPWLDYDTLPRIDLHGPLLPTKISQPGRTLLLLGSGRSQPGPLCIARV